MKPKPVAFARLGCRSSGQRAAASVEAIIVLPVFLLLLFGLVYSRDTFLGQQRAENKARSCAWLYSANNCERVPDGCEGILHPRLLANAGTLSELGDALAEQQELSSDPTGAVDYVMRSLLEPAVAELFGRAVAADATAVIDRPGFFGGGSKTIPHSYHVACNLTPTTPGEVAKRAWEKLWR